MKNNLKVTTMTSVKKCIQNYEKKIISKREVVNFVIDIIIRERAFDLIADVVNLLPTDALEELNLVLEELKKAKYHRKVVVFQNQLLSQETKEDFERSDNEACKKLVGLFQRSLLRNKHREKK